MPVDFVGPINDPSDVGRLLSMCPAHSETPLRQVPELARRLGVTEVWVKDERSRMGLGSFKALGAAHAIAREAAGSVQGDDWNTALAGRTYVTASAGNHGLSVAAGARLFGATAVIYLSETVPQNFAARLAEKGAQVVRAGENYEESMEAAEKAAATQGWTLLSDSSWDGYSEMPLRVMEGYLQMAEEAAQQIDDVPTHIMLQAGVGGLAGAMAAHARRVWGDAPEIIVVEPEAAPALIESVKAGHAVTTEGPVSNMGRLDCKTPSLIALKGLTQDADLFVTITEDEGARGAAELAEFDLATSPSGGAGLSALLAGLELGPEARVLAYLSEGPADD
ncbi:MAG: pyridoxal-phosphate dependent enzyme [Rhodobacteraceae bacterium]|nr:pyridoxal-phosphate dependent enzyme [Paracoccaceae bacterium]